MSIYDKKDILVTPSGDISIGSNGDFNIVRASGVLKQDVTFRVRTNFNEYTPHPNVGADLESLIWVPTVLTVNIYL